MNDPGTILQTAPAPAPTPAPGSVTQAGRTVYLETFGCQMNVLDSQLVRGQLQSLGYRFIEDWQTADVILFNTCSVRDHAEQKVYSRVGIIGIHKKTQPHIVLGVIGCMAERQGIDIVKKYPQIDLICGPGELDKVPLLIDNITKTDPIKRGGARGAQSALQGNNSRRSATLAASEDKLEMLDLSRSFDPDEHKGSAYVRITRGCNKFCTYCVVPQTRGAEVHRPPQSIVDECKRLVDAGVLEITLLGQTVNHYHFDNAASVTTAGVVQPQIGAIVRRNTKAESENIKRDDENMFVPLSVAVDPTKASLPVDASSVTTFANLLQMIHEQVPTLQRLRFVTNYPRDFGDDILRVMRDHERICRFLHLPVQSGSDRILKLMNRDYTVAEYMRLLERARHFLPDAQIASDIITGFPTETDEDHAATLNLLENAGFKNAFIFKYSPRPGTTAIDRLPDNVPEEIKKKRNADLLAVQSRVSAAVHQKMVGQTVRVFVEAVSDRATRDSDAAYPGSGVTVTLGWSKPTTTTQLTGRTDGDLIVCFAADESLVGRIVRVRIDKASPLTLFGSLV
jgi:tRNA-2-methylthio-N6-dimethylallyladenosine synthase